MVDNGGNDLDGGDGGEIARRDFMERREIGLRQKAYN